MSIDCGSSQTTSYKDTLGVEWAPDVSIWPDIDRLTSTANVTPPAADSSTKYQTLRYFLPPTASMPTRMNPTKFCYTLPAIGDAQYYLIRASFWYGASTNTTLYNTRKPGVVSFRIIIDTITGPQIDINLPQTSPLIEEMYIWMETVGLLVPVCFSAASNDSGSPFVNSLELRPLPDSFSPKVGSFAVRTVGRVDLGASTDSQPIIRYFCPKQHKTATLLIVS